MYEGDEERITCQSCNEAIPPGAKFCSMCGKPIESENRGKESGALSKTTPVVCSSCGVELRNRATFCHMCGTALEPESFTRRNESNQKPLEINCGRCRHRLPKQICGATGSPHFNNKIQMEDSCELFLENPAANYKTRGMIKWFSKEYHEAISQLETAINLGLPQDDEMDARFLLGESYCALLPSNIPGLELVSTHNAVEALNEMEKAVILDCQSKYGYFSKPNNRRRLRRLDLLYYFKARAMCDDEMEEVDAPEAYLTEKIHLFDYLPTNPMLQSMYFLSILYRGYDESFGKKCDTLKNILTSEPVDPEDETGQEAKIRKAAKEELTKLELSHDRSLTRPATGFMEAYHRLPEWPRVFIVAGIGMFLGLMFFGRGYVLTLFYFPILLGVAIVVGRSSTFVSWLDRFDKWLIETRKQADEAKDYITRFVSKPILAALTQIMEWSQEMQDQVLRSGVRVTSYLLLITLPLLAASAVSPYLFGIIAGMFLIWLFIVVSGRFSERKR